MTTGAKTSEFYIVLAVLVPWICQQLGIDLRGAIGNADELRQTIEAAHGNGQAPVWVAGAYVIGRKLLKWKQA